jgi:hypothetical protein
MLVVFRDFGLSVAAFPFGFGGHLLLDWRLGMGSTFLYHNIILVLRQPIEVTVAKPKKHAATDKMG